MMFAKNYEKIFNPSEHLYIALHDKGIDKRVHIIDYDRLASANFEGYGVFHTIHSFKTPERKADNVKEVLFWAIDIDDGTKKQMQDKIYKGLKPSYIVETKKGFHIYWKSINATIENYNSIMEKLITYYGADKQAKDLARILRVAGYNHWKTENPFLCKEIMYSEARYSEEQMLYWCNKNVKPKENKSFYNYEKRDDNKAFNPKKEVYEGNRNGFLNWYGYKLKKEKNIDGDTLEALMLEYNQNYLKPPLSENEVMSIYRSLKNVR